MKLFNLFFLCLTIAMIADQSTGNPLLDNLRSLWPFNKMQHVTTTTTTPPPSTEDSANVATGGEGKVLINAPTRCAPGYQLTSQNICRKKF